MWDVQRRKLQPRPAFTKKTRTMANKRKKKGLGQEKSTGVAAPGTPSSAARRAAALIHKEGEKMDSQGPADKLKGLAAAMATPEKALAETARIGREELARVAEQNLKAAQEEEDAAARAYFECLPGRAQKNFAWKTGEVFESARKRKLVKFARADTVKGRARKARAFSECFSAHQNLAQEAREVMEAAELAQQQADKLRASMEEAARIEFGEVSESEEEEEDNHGLSALEADQLRAALALSAAEAAAQRATEEEEEESDAEGSEREEDDEDAELDAMEKLARLNSTQGGGVRSESTPAKDKAQDAKAAERVRLLKEGTDAIAEEEAKGGRGAARGTAGTAAVDAALKARHKEAKSAQGKKDKKKAATATKAEKTATARKAEEQRRESAKPKKAAKGAPRAVPPAAEDSSDDESDGGGPPPLACSSESEEDTEDDDDDDSSSEEEDAGDTRQRRRRAREKARAAEKTAAERRKQKKREERQPRVGDGKRAGLAELLGPTTPRACSEKKGQCRKRDAYVEMYRSLVAASPAPQRDQDRVLLQSLILFFAEVSPAKLLPEGDTADDLMAATVRNSSDAAAGPGRLPRALKTYETALEAMRTRLGMLAMDMGNAERDTPAEAKAMQAHHRFREYVDEIKSTILRSEDTFRDFRKDIGEELDTLVDAKTVKGFSRLQRGSDSGRQAQQQVKMVRNDTNDQFNKIKRQLEDQKRNFDGMARDLKDTKEQLKKMK